MATRPPSRSSRVRSCSCVLFRAQSSDRDVTKLVESIRIRQRTGPHSLGREPEHDGRVHHGALRRHARAERIRHPRNPPRGRWLRSRYGSFSRNRRAPRAERRRSARNSGRVKLPASGAEDGLEVRTMLRIRGGLGSVWAGARMLPRIALRPPMLLRWLVRAHAAEQVLWMLIPRPAVLIPRRSPG